MPAEGGRVRHCTFTYVFYSTLLASCSVRAASRREAMTECCGLLLARLLFLPTVCLVLLVGRRQKLIPNLLKLL